MAKSDSNLRRREPAERRAAPAEAVPEPKRADGGAWRWGFWAWLGRYYLFGLIVIGVHVAALMGALYIHRSRRVPQTPSRVQARSSAQALTRIYGGDGRLIGEFAKEWRRWAPYKEFPKGLVQAFVAVEDRRFFKHGGIDWWGLSRAAWINLSSGRIVQGGSTITQQLAKTYIGSERTVDRKVREAILATRMEAALGKPEIMELYLNRIFFGNGAWGVAAAARRYFDKRLDQLVLAEMALIAGLARAPSRYNPFTNPELSRRRRDVVLQMMREEGFVDAKQLSEALNYGTQDKNGDGKPDLGLRRRPEFFFNEAPYFTEHVRQLVIKRFGREALDRGGLRVETSVDTQVQALARQNIDDLTRWVDKRQGWRGPVAYLPEAAQQTEFRRASRVHYGGQPLRKGKRYLGLVERVVTRGALVWVAGRRLTVPLRYLRWGARFYTRSSRNDRFVSKAWLVLMKGDVVWVRLAPKATYDPLLPGSDGGPSVHSRRYLKPPHGKHSGKPHIRVKRPRVPAGPDWPGAPYLALEQTPRVQSSLYSYDLRSGYVKAMVGGADYDRSNFNRVTQSCRQPGSTYKPIYYSLAMDKGWSYNKRLKDRPHRIIDKETGKIWYQTDYVHNPELQKRFASMLATYSKTLEQALVWSKNQASMDLFVKLGGARPVKRWARKLGFTTEIIADEALALGASCTRTDELTRAFGIFAAGGRRVEPVYIRRVLDRNGDVLLDNSVPYDPMLPPAARFDRLFAWAGQTRPQVISPRTAARTSHLMRKVVTAGHADELRMTGIPVAGKTGTASKTADTWFVGYTSRWVTSAWLGDDHYVRPIGRHDASFSTSMPLYARYIWDAARYHPLREIPWFDADGKRRRDRKPRVAAEGKRCLKPDFIPPFKLKKRHVDPPRR